jgi:hypothetical protein
MCGRHIPVDSEQEYCKACTEELLFKEVREYIRTHEVTEYELADALQIPIGKVRKWIKDGRIEYVTTENKIVNTRCIRCGAPVSLGSYCPDCMRIINGNKGTFHASGAKTSSGKVRFLAAKK